MEIMLTMFCRVYTGGSQHRERVSLEEGKYGKIARGKAIADANAYEVLIHPVIFTYY